MFILKPATLFITIMLYVILLRVNLLIVSLKCVLILIVINLYHYAVCHFTYHSS